MVNYDQPGIGHIIFLVVEANRQDLQRHRELVRRHRAEAEEVQDVLSKKVCDKSAVVSVVLSYFLSCVADIYKYLYLYIHSTYICLYTYDLYII